MNKTYKEKYRHYKEYLLKKTKELSKQPAVKASANLTFTILLVLFFGLFAIKPSLLTLGQLLKELQEKQKINQALEEKIEILQQLKTVYTEASSYLPLADQALPAQAELKQLVCQLNFLAAAYGLKLESVSLAEFDLLTDSSSEKGAEVKNLKFKISALGSFNGLKNFLADLEKLNRLVQVDSVVLSGENKEAQTELRLNLEGKVFWLEKKAS